MAATLLDPWKSWTPPLALASTMAGMDSLNKRDVGPRDGDLLPQSSTHDTSPKNNHALSLGTSLDRLSCFHIHSSEANHNTQLNPPASGTANDIPFLPPPRQLTSIPPLPAQNQPLFPSPLPLPPPPDSSPMLTLLPVNPLQRANKLSKPSRISAMPPVLAPLSFTEEPELDLDFEHVSHDVQRTLSRSTRQSLTLEKQDIPPPELCERAIRPSSLPRRLTKRRRPSLPSNPQPQIVPSSSGAAAAAAITGNPSAPIAAVSQISSPISPFTSSRARSDVGHELRSSLSTKRSSIIRRLSMRSPKCSLDASSQTTSTTSGISSSAAQSSASSSLTRWTKWRGTPSEPRHHTMKEEFPVFLPLVRVTSPLSITLPSKPSEEDTAPPVLLSPIKTNLGDSRPFSPTALDSAEPPNPIHVDTSHPRSRAKFTLEENESEIEPSSPLSGSTTPALVSPHSHSAPPSRTPSAYKPQFLSPISRYGRDDQAQKRRWTFAMAMTDEDIPDEVLVEELERMRLQEEWSGSVDDVGEVWDANHILFGSQELTASPREERPQHYKLNDLPHSQPSTHLPYTSSLPSFPHQQHRNSSMPPPVSGSTRHWQTAHRVLLTCRELVRTERHYLASLQALLASETETAPPPLMLRYAEELVKVSKLFLAEMEANPSAWGIAAAFVGVEEAIDGAFTGWCGVVGMWFDDEQQEAKMKMTNGSLAWSSVRAKKLSKPSKPKLGDEDTKEKGKEKEKELEDEASSSPLMKRVNTWRRSMTSITDLSANVPGSRKKEKNAVPPPSFYINGHGQQRQNKMAKKPPVRDLAILPTQRIMRYVLLYRDLLAHTSSTSPSRALIKRAADAALRIAQKCDRAQTNSIFIIDSRKGSSPAVTTASTPGCQSPPDNLKI